MSNYTTKTAALKATKIDTRVLDAKQIDTKKLFINGEFFDPSQIKENANDAMFIFFVIPLDGLADGFKGYWRLTSIREEQYEGSIETATLFEASDYVQKGSESNGVLDDGIYAVIPINDNFIKCIGGISLEETEGFQSIYNIPDAKFRIGGYSNDFLKTIVNTCVLENFIIIDNLTQGVLWAIKLAEEDDNLSELYGGGTTLEDSSVFVFIISIPYYNPEKNYIYKDSSSSNYSLRNQQINLFSNLHEQIEEMKQQMLDKSAE